MGYIEEIRKKIGHDCLLLPGSAVVIADREGKILLQHRVYPEGKWSLPGGLMELGESPEETAVREVYEETNLRVSKLELLNVYSGKNYLCIAANGDNYYVVTIVYMTETYEGDLKVNDNESKEFRWFSLEELPEKLVATHQTILSDYKIRKDSLNSNKN